jgi:type IX secretion system PorP/SprF family membrane protein
LPGNLYHENAYYVNPAYAGSSGFLRSGINYRHTSSAFPASPKLLFFGLESPVYNKMSLGGRIYVQSEGLFSLTSIYADYSYRLKLAKDQNLSFGISAGLKSAQIKHSEIIAEDPSAIIDVASRVFEGNFFESAAGIVYEWGNLELGFSVPRLFESKTKFKPAYNGLFSYKFYLKEKELEIKPSIFATYNARQPFLYDLNLHALWRNQVMFGITYRNTPGAIISIGYRFMDIAFQYAIEMGMQKQSGVFNNIHEVSIGYTFKKRKSLPVDNDTLPEIPFITKTDSLKKDSFMVIAGNHDLPADTTSGIKEIKPYYTIEETGKGIYVIKQVELDSSKTVLDTSHFISKEKLLKLDKDSVLAGQMIENLDKKAGNKDYELVQVSQGIYSVKMNEKSGQDSAKISGIHSENADSLENVYNLFDKIIKEQRTGSEEKTLKEEMYTIQLFINNSNNYILRDAEIAVQTRFETDKKGQFIYFFGRYSSLEEAKSMQLKLTKYKDLLTKILKWD